MDDDQPQSELGEPEEGQPEQEQPAQQEWEVPPNPNQPTLDQRFENLKTLADLAGSEISLSITIGGIVPGERYIIWRTQAPEATLEEQITQAEKEIVDVRLLATAEATHRMLDAERLQKGIDALVRVRQHQYATAAKAFRQAFEHEGKPEDGDGLQTLASEMLMIERELPMSETLAKMLGQDVEQPQQP